MIYTSLRKHFFLFFHASCMLNKNTHYSLSQCSILLFLKICFMKAQWTQELGFQMRQKDKKISDIWYLSLSRILVQHESRTVAYSSQGDILAVNSPVCSLTVVEALVRAAGSGYTGKWMGLTPMKGICRTDEVNWSVSNTGKLNLHLHC